MLVRMRVLFDAARGSGGLYRDRGPRAEWNVMGVSGPV